MSNSNPNVPYQVQSVIDSLLNTKENLYIRQNYRMRLDEIRVAIDAAIKKYDNEVAFTDSKKKRKA